MCKVNEVTIMDDKKYINDWCTGTTRHRTILGKDNRANGAYAIIQFFDNGDLLYNSVSGPFRVEIK